MKQCISWISSRGFWRETQGQDLIEYALMAGFVAVAAGAVMPQVAGAITTIFGKITSLLAAAAA
jgi:pilus assembly protein Flp/PilA